MSELSTIVSGRLRQCRLQAGWTQVGTAERLNSLSGQSITKSAYSNWELGLRMPLPEQIIHLAKLFGKPPAWIQGFTENDSLGAISANYVTANTPNISTKTGLLPVTQATDSTAYSLEYLAGRGLNKNKLLSILQLDTSMHGVIEEGDEVLLDGDSTEVRGAGLFGIVVSGLIWIRWIRPEMGDTFTLWAEDRENYPPKTLTREELDELDIVGRVVRVAHDR